MHLDMLLMEKCPFTVNRPFPCYYRRLVSAMTPLRWNCLWDAAPCVRFRDITTIASWEGPSRKLIIAGEWILCALRSLEATPSHKITLWYKLPWGSENATLKNISQWMEQSWYRLVLRYISLSASRRQCRAYSLVLIWLIVWCCYKYFAFLVKSNWVNTVSIPFHFKCKLIDRASSTHC